MTEVESLECATKHEDGNMQVVREPKFGLNLIKIKGGILTEHVKDECGVLCAD